MAREIKAGWFDSNEVMAELGVNQDMIKKRVRKITETQRKTDTAALAEIRTRKGVTQVGLAKRMGITQNRVSQIELANLHTTQVDTLRNYIEALGGDLIIGAVINGEVVLIQEAPPKKSI